MTCYICYTLLHVAARNTRSNQGGGPVLLLHLLRPATRSYA